MFQIRAHKTDGGIYVFDPQAQPAGAQHVYWWSMRENEMSAFALDAPFFAGMELVRNKEELEQAAEKYRQWAQKYLAAFIAEWSAYWANRNRPPPTLYANHYYDDSDRFGYSYDIESQYDEGDMPSISDGYGDTGEGGWDYDNT